MSPATIAALYAAAGRSGAERSDSARAEVIALLQAATDVAGDTIYDRVDVLIGAAYIAGMAEGRAQVKRERDAERLEYLATEFDR